MTLTVEDGTGLSNADSYASAATASTYAAANGLSWPSDVPTQESSLRRATTWIDATYRARFPGYRLNRRLQSLEWPRAQAYLQIQGGAGPSPSFYGERFGVLGQDWFDQVNQFDYVLPNVVPPEVVKATIEAAVREAQVPGVLLGDVSTQGQSQIKKEAAGDTSFEYFPGSVVASTTSGNMRFPLIDAILAGILVQSSAYATRAARA